MKDLIATLEKAAGPDRDFDADIHEAIGFGRCSVILRDFPQRYTSSIDAAMTLVPEGYDWIVARTNDGMTIHACCGSTKEHFADTPALALCIAALKARLP